MRSDSISDKMGASVCFARFSSSAGADLEVIFNSRERLVRRSEGTQTKSVIPVLPKPPSGRGKTPLILSAALLVFAIGGAGAFYFTNMPDVIALETRRPEPVQSSALLVQAPSVPAIAPEPAPEPPLQEPVAAPVPPSRAEAQSQPVERPRPAPARRASADPFRSNPDCVGLGRRDRAICMRPQVIAADQKMRASYARAVSSGVGSRMLNSYQRNWTSLLGQTDSDPHHVTAVLNRMAREMDEERLR